MSKKKQKYYVVWQGKEPGIYGSWGECQRQVVGVAAAKYKSFETQEDAERAFGRPPDEWIGANAVRTTDRKKALVGIDENGMTQILPHPEGAAVPVLDSIAVDAACSGNPGVMEYRGVYVATRQQLFHYKAAVGTNNIGEFLGIVHGLSYLKKHHLDKILYSDSAIAINWVKRKECRSKLPLTTETAELWNLVRRAEAWLEGNSYSTEIRKWDTDSWGEIPADFGRK